jgi:drug/metabolite transporter (DMT)-like permease
VPPDLRYNHGVDASTVGALCALGSALSWSVTSLMVRSLAPGIGTFTVNAARTALTAALVVAWALAAGGLPVLLTLSAGNLALLVVSIVLAILVGDTIFFDSTQRLGLGRAMTISMSYPLVAAALAAVLIGERLTPAIVAGGLVTLAGLALIVLTRVEVGGEPRPWLGLVEAVVAAVTWGVSAVALRIPLDAVDVLTAQALRLPVGAVLLWATPWALRGAPALVRGGWPLWGRLVALAGLTAVSSVMYGAAIKHAGVAVATVLSSTAPLFAVPLGMIFLGERLPVRAVVGAVVTVAGIVVLRL